MNSKKLMGVLGVLLGVGASVYHLVDPTTISEKYVPVYTAIGLILALFGTHPTKVEDKKE